MCIFTLGIKHTHILWGCNPVWWNRGDYSQGRTYVYIHHHQVRKSLKIAIVYIFIWPTCKIHNPQKGIGGDLNLCYALSLTLHFTVSLSHTHALQTHSPIPPSASLDCFRVVELPGSVVIFIPSASELVTKWIILCSTYYIVPFLKLYLSLQSYALVCILLMLFSHILLHQHCQQPLFKCIRA